MADGAEVVAVHLFFVLQRERFRRPRFDWFCGGLALKYRIIPGGFRFLLRQHGMRRALEEIATYLALHLPLERAAVNLFCVGCAVGWMTTLIWLTVQ